MAMTFNIGSDADVCSHIGVSLRIANGEHLALRHPAADPL